MRELTLYSRPGCHLCHYVLEELEPLCAGAGVTLREVDVDTDERWRERFGVRIPVVCAGEEELSGWPFDRERVRAWIGRR